VTQAILLVCSVLGAVTGLVTAFIAWDTWRRERRYRQTPEWVGGSSYPAPDDEPPPNPKLWWGLAGIAAAVAVGSFLGWRANYPGPSEWNVEILSTQGWTDTRVDCKAGYVLEITADGTIYHNKTMSEGVSPDGDPNRDLRKFNVDELRNANHAALIGRIDGRQPFFLVGEKKTYECPAKGGLFLGINDTGLNNNRGKFVATIKERTIASRDSA
jgi:hypothetical protein